MRRLALMLYPQRFTYNSRVCYTLNLCIVQRLDRDQVCLNVILKDLPPYPKCGRVTTFIHEINTQVWEVACRKFKCSWWKAVIFTYVGDYGIKLPICIRRCRIKIRHCKCKNFMATHLWQNCHLFLHPHLFSSKVKCIIVFFFFTDERKLIGWQWTLMINNIWLKVIPKYMVGTLQHFRGARSGLVKASPVSQRTEWDLLP